MSSSKAARGSASSTKCSWSSCGNSDRWVNVTKTRISFQARVRFAGVSRIIGNSIVCRFWLKREIQSPRLSKTELIPPRDYVYEFKLTDATQLDDEMAAWLKEAYEVGTQSVQRGA
jgi:hypothetical protein